MGTDDSLWLVRMEEDTIYSALRFRLFHGLTETWDTLPSILDTLGDGDPNSVSFFRDHTGIPSVITWNWQNPPVDSFRLYRFLKGAWRVRWIVKPRNTILWAVGEDTNAHVHLIAMGAYDLYHGSDETGEWVWEIVDLLDWQNNEGDFGWSVVLTFMDDRDRIHILYDPFIYSQGEYQLRYAFRDSSCQWHKDTPVACAHETWSNPAADGKGTVHFAYGNGYPIYHWYKVAGENYWNTEPIGNISNSPRLRMCVDKQDYLHLFAQDWDLSFIYYATTNPDIGLWEASSHESRQSLILSMVPSGFMISGYTGPVQVYDATGRLLMSRDVRGKTLISPLRPGVYFVVGGKQRGKIAVR